MQYMLRNLLKCQIDMISPIVSKFHAAHAPTNPEGFHKNGAPSWPLVSMEVEKLYLHYN